jgi:hypothetical protein
MDEFDTSLTQMVPLTCGTLLVGGLLCAVWE